jgi:hypothetical protein
MIFKEIQGSFGARDWNHNLLIFNFLLTLFVLCSTNLLVRIRKDVPVTLNSIRKVIRILGS